MKILEQFSFYKKLYTHYYFSKIKNKKNAHNEYQDNYQNIIPKTIHYCWFGGKDYPELVKRCINSWGEVLPEYKFVLWNEENFDLSQYKFAEQAYKNKKYAFVSDVARLYALYNYGGIYMDTDVEMLKPLDRFLNHGVFSSYESDNLIPTALLGAKKKHPWIKLLLSWYENNNVDKYDYTTANTRIISKITSLHFDVTLNGKEFCLPDDVHIYPANFFCPRNEITDNTYCIHHMDGSWLK